MSLPGDGARMAPRWTSAPAGRAPLPVSPPASTGCGCRRAPPGCWRRCPTTATERHPSPVTRGEPCAPPLRPIAVPRAGEASYDSRTAAERKERCGDHRAPHRRRPERPPGHDGHARLPPRRGLRERSGSGGPAGQRGRRRGLRRRRRPVRPVRRARTGRGRGAGRARCLRRSGAGRPLRSRGRRLTRRREGRRAGRTPCGNGRTRRPRCAPSPPGAGRRRRCRGRGRAGRGRRGLPRRDRVRRRRRRLPR